MTDMIAPSLRTFLAEGRSVALVTVAEAKGSTPREMGARMLVTERETRGSIGGGELEFRAIAQARDFLKRDSLPTILDVALGPELGQCCGGRVSVSIERADERALASIELAERAAAQTRPMVLVFGAGHVGRALARSLSLLPFRVRWIDARGGEFGTAPLGDNVEMIVTERWGEEVGRAPPDAAYVVLTHSHSLDSLIVSAVLERGDLRLDPARRSASRAGLPLDLGPKEFGVLELLLASQGRIVSAEELLERVWDEAADPFTTAVKITVSRLRAKLGNPPVIETVAKSGYRI